MSNGRKLEFYAGNQSSEQRTEVQEAGQYSMQGGCFVLLSMFIEEMCVVWATIKVTHLVNVH